MFFQNGAHMSLPCPIDVHEGHNAVMMATGARHSQLNLLSTTKALLTS